LQGPGGVQGPPGYGIPSGGLTNQYLIKLSNANYDFGWGTPSGGGGISLPLTQNLTFSPSATLNIGDNSGGSRPYRIFAESDITLGNNQLQLQWDLLSSASQLRLNSGPGDLSFQTGNTTRWYLPGGGGDLLAIADNTYDIGQVTARRPRSVYAATSVVAPSNYLYNMYTNATNYERLEINWSGNVAYLLSNALGTATQRPLTIGTNGGYLALRTSGTDRWTVQPTGHLVAAADNAYDIGAAGANRPRDVYVADKLAVNATLPTGNTRFQVGGDGYITGLFGIGAGPQGGVALTVGGSNYGHGLWSTCAVNPAGNGWQIDAVRVDGVPTNTGSFTSVDYRSFYIGAITVPAGYAFNYGLYIGAPNGATTNLGLYNAGATQLVGALSIGNNATPPIIRTPAGSNQSLSLESPLQYAFLSSRTGSHIAGNAYWDGSNWQRYDVAQPSSYVVAGQSAIQLATAPAGANPITWTNRMSIDAASGLVTLAGNLTAANFPAGAWTNSTVTLTQGVAISLTPNWCRWAQYGKLVVVDVDVNITSAGTAGSQIQANLNAGIPAPLNSGSYIAKGVYMYIRTGTAFYCGTALMATRTVSFVDSGQGNFIGGAPSFAVANGDGLSFQVFYETA